MNNNNENSNKSKAVKNNLTFLISSSMFGAIYIYNTAIPDHLSFLLFKKGKN